MTFKLYYPADWRGLETDNVTKRKFKVVKHNGFTSSIWQFFDEEGKMLGMYCKTIKEKELKISEERK